MLLNLLTLNRYCKQRFKKKKKSKRERNEKVSDL